VSGQPSEPTRAPEALPARSTGAGSPAAGPTDTPPAPASEEAPGTTRWERFAVYPYRQIVLTEHPAMERFFAERCPHLAGMIAYFGILSIIPAAFVFLSVLALSGYLKAQGWIVRELEFVMPREAVTTIVSTVGTLRAHSSSLGLIGGIGLVWATSNFFSCIESALNIIYGVNNRWFLKQKGLVLVLMTTALACMVLGSIAVTVSVPLLKGGVRLAHTYLHVNVTETAISYVLSTAFAFIFFLSCYRFLPNTPIRTRECWRGAAMAAILFEASIHVLPLYLTYNRDGVVLKAFAGAFIVLIWFYIVSFILLAGGVYNWWQAEKRRRAVEGDVEAAGIA
jgi:YihY family inner membrane protein